MQDDLDVEVAGKYKKLPFKTLKQTAEKHVIEKTATKIKDKAQPVKALVSDKIDGMKVRGQDYLDYLGVVKGLTEEQLADAKVEIRVLKKIFQSKDPIYFKTDAFAVVTRKFGKTDEFLSAVDKLTREGYILREHEIIRNIPIGGGISFPIGSFYYFQHSKYITGQRGSSGKSPLHNIIDLQ